MKYINIFFLLVLFIACNPRKLNSDSYNGSVSTQGYAVKTLPPPFATGSSQNFSDVTGWKEGEHPTAPPGFQVEKFAEGFSHPRWIYVSESGDIFIAESNTILKGIKKIGAKLSRKIKTQHIGESANRIILLRDTDQNGLPDKRYVFLQKLNQPFGMLILGMHFYVGNTDALIEYDYTPGDTAIKTRGKKIIDLPAGKYNRHWTRNIISNEQGTKIYIAVGSGTNVAEKGLDNEKGRAEIMEINPDGSDPQIYASGLRNPVGMGWAPGTKTLWTAVNERDELGDELVPDYLTHVKKSGFYGWPYSYYGEHVDPRMKETPRPDLVATAIVPDIPIGSHTASLGLVFYEKKSFPQHYQGGAFITQHGSWNRSVLSGYKVVFVPFINGMPSGPVEDFLYGFMGNLDKSEVHGRPVGIALLKDGSMLVSDDVNGIIWKISYGH
jgi:glucose/arabinose dehydrogenase